LVTSFTGKLLKIVATRCHIFRRKCTKFDFGWGSAPDPAGGAYSAPPDPLAGIKGPTSKERGGKGRGTVGGKERKGKKERGASGGGRGESAPLPQTKILPTPLVKPACSVLNYARTRRYAIQFQLSSQLSQHRQSTDEFPMHLSFHAIFKTVRWLPTSYILERA